MSRSKWKGPFIDEGVYKARVKQKGSKSKANDPLVVRGRNSEILPMHLGKIFCVHNGKEFLELMILEAMVGYKFGEFIPTRARFIFKVKKKKNK